MTDTDKIHRATAAETQLKPCPFCGRELSLEKDDYYGPGGDVSYYHEGDDCVLSQSVFFSASIPLWNTRAITHGTAGQDVRKG